MWNEQKKGRGTGRWNIAKEEGLLVGHSKGRGTGRWDIEKEEGLLGGT